MTLQLIATMAKKGGVAKTGAIVAAANYVNHSDKRWKGFDLDPNNKSFAARYPLKVTSFDLLADGGIRDERELTRLATEIGDVIEADETDVLLVDCPAGGPELLLGAMRETELDAAFGKTIALTVLYPVVNSLDSVSTLADSFDALNSIAGRRWVVVRNEVAGPLSIYDASKIREKLRAANAAEMTMPLVRDPAAMAAWTASLLPLADFIDPVRKVADFGVRGRISAWATAMHAEFDRIGLVR